MAAFFGFAGAGGVVVFLAGTTLAGDPALVAAAAFDTAADPFAGAGVVSFAAAIGVPLVVVGAGRARLDPVPAVAEGFGASTFTASDFFTGAFVGADVAASDVAAAFFTGVFVAAALTAALTGRAFAGTAFAGTALAGMVFAVAAVTVAAVTVGVAAFAVLALDLEADTEPDTAAELGLAGSVMVAFADVGAAAAFAAGARLR